MKKWATVVGAVVAAVAIAVACRGVSRNVAAPDEPAATQGAAVAAVNAPESGGTTWDFLPNAGWKIVNGSSEVRTYTAYLTSFDDQRTSLASKSAVVGAGSNWRDEFGSAAYCRQLDLTTGGPGGVPFAYVYVDAVGKLHDDPRTVDFAACQPKPTPTPSPTPCSQEWPSVTANTVCPSPSPTPTPRPSPTPTPGLCYYRVSCGVSFGTHGSSCTDSNQQFICEHTSSGNVAGIWRNFGAQSLQNHCQFPVPGVSLRNFQLNPGQSAEGCRNKNSD